MYKATIRMNDGREVLVLPRGKRVMHKTVDGAVKTIEMWGRRGIYGQGRVYGINGEMVTTIAV